MKKPVQKNNPAGQTLHIDQPISRSTKRRMRRRLNSLEARKPGTLAKYGLIRKSSNELDIAMMQVFVHTFERSMSQGCSEDTAKKVAQYSAETYVAKGGPGSGCNGDNCGRPKSGDIVHRAENRTDLKIGSTVTINDGHSGKGTIVAFHPNQVVEIKRTNGANETFHSSKVSLDPKSGEKTGRGKDYSKHTNDDLVKLKGAIQDENSSKPSKEIRAANDKQMKAIDRELKKREKPVKKNSEFDQIVVPIIKANSEKQIIYGVVLTPDEEDTQEDVISADEIEKTAHAYMLNSRVVGSGHTKTIKARPVESYIAPMDMTFESGLYGTQKVKKGAWVLGVKVDDPKEWEKVSEGHYTGYSIGGVGIRD